MKKNYTLVLDSEMFLECKQMVESVGLSIDSAVNMFLKRLLNDGDLTFLLKKERGDTAVIKNGITAENNVGSITKTKAIRLFNNKGMNVADIATYSSKNKSADFYWANPNFEVLDDNWSLILNNWIDKKLILFNIPRKAIRANQLKPRADKEMLVDLQIAFNDSTYSDNRSGFSFLKYLVGEIDY